MKTAVLLAAIAAFTISVAAQQPAAGQQSSAALAEMGSPHEGSTSADPLTLSILRSAACPVSLQANFNSFRQMLKVRKPGTPDPDASPRPGQHIRVVIADPSHKNIASVTVTAYGLTARPRMDRSSDTFARGASGIRRTLTVPSSAGENGSHFADLDLPGFTAVQGVKLDAIRFADGSRREFADQSLCSVPVNPMMLVADR